jgi:hypothetical protein
MQIDRQNALSPKRKINAMPLIIEVKTIIRIERGTINHTGLALMLNDKLVGNPEYIQKRTTCPSKIINQNQGI